MRIVLIGQAAFGEKVLEALLNKGEEVVAVYTPPGKPDRSNSVQELAEEKETPVYQPENWRDPQVYAEYIKLGAELNVMAYVTDILPRRILDYPRYGSIQYHPSLLPKHRGGSAINWAIIKGETKTGLTIFWPDEGIDTGPILLQREVKISPDDTVGSLYFEKLFPLGVEAIVEAVEMVERGTAPRIPQDELQATYEGLCREEDAIINWQQPVAEVYDLIRGTNPRPGATTFFQKGKLKIFDCQRRDVAINAQPGEVVDVSKQSFLVACQGGTILVTRVQPRGLPKINAGEYARSIGLKVGDRLGR